MLELVWLKAGQSPQFFLVSSYELFFITSLSLHVNTLSVISSETGGLGRNCLAFPLKGEL